MKEKLKQNRIWEIDAARGIGIICVVIVHAFCFLSDFSSVQISWSPFFIFIKQYAGAFFVFLSGLSVSLGSKSFKRGVVVFLCGMVLTGCTEYLFLNGFENEQIQIQWGVLHLVGFCMMLYPLTRKLSWKILVPAGVAMLVFGYYIHENVYLSPRMEYLFPLGFRSAWFFSYDWFPILPYMGWFLLGSVVGTSAYREKKSLLASWNSEFFLFRFFRWCGRNSLQIYMVQMISFYFVAKRI